MQPLVEKGAGALVGSLDDTEFLSRSFTGADAVFGMIPPNLTASDLRGYQNQIGEALATAIKNAGVKQVVNLSSIAGHLADGTGPIKGLHDNEERFNELKDVNVIHLRPGFFMENLLFGVEVIKKMGMNGGLLDPQVALPMIATRDIAIVAADLMAGSFSEKSVREILGQRDLTMTEATTAIGNAIGKPDLKYVQFPYDDARKAMLEMGMSQGMVDEMIEMYRGMNSGIVRPSEARSPENTTATTIGEFARSTFAAAYVANKEQSAARTA